MNVQKGLYATESLLAGKPIPGWKVVAGKSNRAFKDTDAAIKAVMDMGYDEAMLYVRKPISAAFRRLKSKLKRRTP